MALVGNVRTNLYLILNAMAQQLVTSGVFSDINRIRILARYEDIPAFQADHQALFRPRGFRKDSGMDEAAGRQTIMLTRQVDISPRTRFGGDEAYSDKNWLVSQTNGHLLLEEAVIDSLQEFWPGATSGGNALTVQPIRVILGSDYEKPNKKDRMWGDCTLAFEVKYLLNVNQSIQ